MNAKENELIKECLAVLLCVVVVFVCALLFGAYLGNEIYNPEDIILVKKSTREIFLNNISVMFTNLAGVFFLGIPNIISCALNGFYLGMALSGFCIKFGVSKTIASFAFHSLIEIPIIIITTSYGGLPWLILLNIIRKKKDVNKKLLLYIRIIIISVLISIPLLLMAAFIEANISMNY